MLEALLKSCQVRTILGWDGVCKGLYCDALSDSISALEIGHGILFNFRMDIVDTGVHMGHVKKTIL